MRALMLVTANVMMNKTANKTTIVGAGALSIKRTTRHQSLTLLPICQSPVGAQYESVVSGVPQWRGRNEQRNGENDTYRFQRRHNGQRDHAQQPIMQPSRMQTAYLRLLIIKAEQQKSRHFTLITSVTSPAIIIVWIISPMVIPSMSPKRIWSRCTSGLTAIYKIRPAANMPEKQSPSLYLA